ncbi:MAG: DUF1540 domain-containing protein [Firmicutes bacterium]|nr:DUF1540 domain-containing protein [Bacillota bacterium]
MSANKNIRCSVSNCHYWADGNYCSAEQIVVTSDRMGDTTPHTFNALEASQFPRTPAGSSMETCCKTFVTKGDDAKADRVKRME